ncbi:MAG: hypothetical protein C4337_09970 [Armatimonadota bacterium]
MGRFLLARGTIPRMGRLYGVAVGIAMLLLVCGSSQRLKPEQRMEVFQFVWEEVRNSHYDPKLGGVDWNALREAFIPRIRSATTDSEFYNLLNEMLSKLGQSHMGVIPPGVYVAGRGGRVDLTGRQVGLVVQLVEGRPVVVRVVQGSPAMRAGIPAGSELLRIDDTDAQSVLDAVRTRPLSVREERMQVQIAFAERLSGAPGSKVQVCYRDLEGQERTVELIRDAPRSEVAQFGSLPPIPTYIEARRLPGNIGYIAFNAFMPSLMKQIPEIIRSMRETRGLIIDLRGNIGGVGLMAGGVAGYLVDKETPLGTMYLRSGTYGIVAYPQQGAYRGPVVVLVDEVSISTAEIFAGGLQEAKRATVVGRPTPGMALPSKVIELPHGGLLQCVIANFETPSKRRIEEVGVQPDVPVELTRAMFRQSEDPILQKALEILQERRSTTPRLK